MIGLITTQETSEMGLSLSEDCNGSWQPGSVITNVLLFSKLVIPMPWSWSSFSYFIHFQYTDSQIYWNAIYSINHMVCIVCSVNWLQMQEGLQQHEAHNQNNTSLCATCPHTFCRRILRAPHVSTSQHNRTVVRLRVPER